ncbi:MAG: hapE [Subtercola sp.]|nr:hapE [Subtercola sp.]
MVKKSAKVAPTIAIVGAGFGGVNQAVQLKRAGLYRVTIYEKSSGIGGTWWHNTYPGAEVDTPSILYSFSYMPWNWSRTHVRQAELQEYIEAVAEKYDVTRHIRFNTEIEDAVWNESRQEYELYAAGAIIGRANFLITAVGMLDEPNRPTWPGLDTFAGPVFHTSQWLHDVDFEGKVVAVAGSGSTATQVVPEVAKVAKRVVMFQREPGWIVPKNDREFSDDEREALDSSIAQRIARTTMIYNRDKVLVGGKMWTAGTPQNAAGEAAARNHINNQLGDRPDLVELVTPTYSYMGKRPIISDSFYPALKRENVSLIPKAVSAVTPNGVVTTDGQEYSCDVLVLSTGFTVRFLSNLKVHGRTGAEMQDYWRSTGARAFLGMLVTDYPNLFILYGPNTNGGSIVSNLELQAKYITSAIAYARRARANTIEVKTAAFEKYDRRLMQALEGTVWNYQNNYYKSGSGGSGRITTQWPDALMVYGALTKVLRGPLVWKLGYRTGRSASAQQNTESRATLPKLKAPARVHRTVSVASRPSEDTVDA